MAYKKLSRESVKLSDLYPCLDDSTPVTPFDPHYFYQSAWVARKLSHNGKKLHLDVASQIDLIAPLSAFMEIEFVDIRPLEATLPNLKIIKGSILDLPYADKSILSLSCLHVIEHIGLGRYGDLLDPEGTKKACKELQRVLGPGGNLYLSTPIGRERVEFNAHRVFLPETILLFFDELALVNFSCVDDSGELKTEARIEDCEEFEYGLGLFHFTRNRV